MNKTYEVVLPIMETVNLVFKGVKAKSKKEAFEIAKRRLEEQDFSGDDEEVDDVQFESEDMELVKGDDDAEGIPHNVSIVEDDE